MANHEAFDWTVPIERTTKLLSEFWLNFVCTQTETKVKRKEFSSFKVFQSLFETENVEDADYTEQPEYHSASLTSGTGQFILTVERWMQKNVKDFCWENKRTCLSVTAVNQDSILNAVTFWIGNRWIQTVSISTFNGHRLEASDPAPFSLTWLRSVLHQTHLRMTQQRPIKRQKMTEVSEIFCQWFLDDQF